MSLNISLSDSRSVKIVRNVTLDKCLTPCVFRMASFDRGILAHESSNGYERKENLNGATR